MPFTPCLPARAVPDYRLELLEAREVGDFVVAKVRARGRRLGRTTPFETALWLAIEWNRGRLLWWRSFGTEREAATFLGFPAIRRSTAKSRAVVLAILLLCCPTRRARIGLGYPNDTGRWNG